MTRMMERKSLITISRERRIELTDLPKGAVTLDGEPAKVCGYNCPFAMVRVANGDGVEFSWDTVERIVTLRNGEFRR